MPHRNLSLSRAVHNTRIPPLTTTEEASERVDYVRRADFYLAFILYLGTQYPCPRPGDTGAIFDTRVLDTARGHGYRVPSFTVRAEYQDVLLHTKL